MKKISFVFVLLLFLAITSSLTIAVIIPFPEDSDNDGVNDEQDLCPNTEAGQIVNLNGCSILQSILQLCSPNVKNHGEYVSCIARISEEFLEQGLISEQDKDIIVSEAAKSDIGKK